LRGSSIKHLVCGAAKCSFIQDLASETRSVNKDWSIVDAGVKNDIGVEIDYD